MLENAVKHKITIEWKKYHKKSATLKENYFEEYNNIREWCMKDSLCLVISRVITMFFSKTQVLHEIRKKIKIIRIYYTYYF